MTQSIRRGRIENLSEPCNTDHLFEYFTTKIPILYSFPICRVLTMAVLTVLSPPTSSSSSRRILYNFNKYDSTNCYFWRKNFSKWTPLPTISAVSTRKTGAPYSQLQSMQSSNSSGNFFFWIRLIWFDSVLQTGDLKFQFLM